MISRASAVSSRSSVRCSISRRTRATSSAVAKALLRVVTGRDRRLRARVSAWKRSTTTAIAVAAAIAARWSSRARSASPSPSSARAFVCPVALTVGRCGLQGCQARVGTPRQGRHLANLVEHRSADSVVGIGAKGGFLIRIEATRGSEETFPPRAQQIIDIDGAGSRAESLAARRSRPDRARGENARGSRVNQRARWIPVGRSASLFQPSVRTRPRPLRMTQERPRSRGFSDPVTLRIRAARFGSLSSCARTVSRGTNSSCSSETVDLR